MKAILDMAIVSKFLFKKNFLKEEGMNGGRERGLWTEKEDCFVEGQKLRANEEITTRDRRRQDSLVY